MNTAVIVDAVRTPLGKSNGALRDWHPVDLAACGDVLFLPLMVPWGASRTGVELVERLGPKQVIPSHDFYLSDGGRAFIYEFVGGAIAEGGVEFVPLAYGDSYTV